MKNKKQTTTTKNDSECKPKYKSTNGKTTTDDIKPCGFMELGGKCFANDEQLDIYHENWLPKQTRVTNARTNSHRRRAETYATSVHQKKALCETLFDELVSSRTPKNDKKEIISGKDNIEIIIISSDSEKSDDGLGDFLAREDRKSPPQKLLNEIKTENDTSVKYATKNTSGEIFRNSSLKRKPENQSKQTISYHESKRQHKNTCLQSASDICSHKNLRSLKMLPQTAASSMTNSGNNEHQLEIQNEWLTEDPFAGSPSYEIPVHEMNVKAQVLSSEKATQTTYQYSKFQMSHLNTMSTQTEGLKMINPVKRLHAIQNEELMKNENEKLNLKEDTAVKSTGYMGYNKNLQAVTADLLFKTINEKTIRDLYIKYDKHNSTVTDSSDNEMMSAESLQLMPTQEIMTPTKNQPNVNYSPQTFLIAGEISPCSNNSEENIVSSSPTIQDILQNVSIKKRPIMPTPSISQLKGFTSCLKEDHKHDSKTSPSIWPTRKEIQFSYENDLKPMLSNALSSSTLNKILETFKDITGRIRQKSQFTNDMAMVISSQI